MIAELPAQAQTWTHWNLISAGAWLIAHWVVEVLSAPKTLNKQLGVQISFRSVQDAEIEVSEVAISMLKSHTVPNRWLCKRSVWASVPSVTIACSWVSASRVSWRLKIDAGQREGVTETGPRVVLPQRAFVGSDPKLSQKQWKCFLLEDSLEKVSLITYEEAHNLIIGWL